MAAFYLLRRALTGLYLQRQPRSEETKPLDFSDSAWVDTNGNLLRFVSSMAWIPILQSAQRQPSRTTMHNPILRLWQDDDEDHLSTSHKTAVSVLDIIAVAVDWWSCFD